MDPEEYHQTILANNNASSSTVVNPISPLHSEALMIQELFGSELINPHALTASWLLEDSLHSHTVLSTGSKNLDRLLCGGINTNEITELYGLSGHGKSQICISTAVSTLFHSFRSSSSLPLSPSWSSSSSNPKGGGIIPSTILYYTTKTQAMDIASRMYQLLFDTFKDEIGRYNIDQMSKQESTIAFFYYLYPHGMDYLYKQFINTGAENNSNNHNNSNNKNNPQGGISIPPRTDTLFTHYTLQHYLDCITYETKYLLQYISLCTVLEPNDLLDKLQTTIQYCSDNKTKKKTSNSTLDTTSSIVPPILIIIDSIYAIISPVMGGPRNFLGHGYMVEISHRLRWLASTFHCAILITNNAVVERTGYPNEDTLVSKYATTNNKYSSSSSSFANKRTRPSDLDTTGTQEENIVTDIQTLRYSRVPNYRSALGPSWGRIPDTSLFIFRDYGGNEEEWEYDILPEQERIIAIHRSNRLSTFTFSNARSNHGPIGITTMNIRNVIDYTTPRNPNNTINIPLI